MAEQITVMKILAKADLEKAQKIRRMVFVDEQHCPAELEWANEEESVHFLATFLQAPCGAARWRKTDKGYKLERFAVLKEFRAKGVGSALVQAVLDDLPADGRRRYLNAQTDAMPLYAKFGFRPVGQLFTEAGIIHRQMVLE